jgi:hypothetical protein
VNLANYYALWAQIAERNHSVQQRALLSQGSGTSGIIRPS